MLIQETQELSVPLCCEQSGSSEQMFYGKITDSLPISFVSQTLENFEMRIKESPKDRRISSPPLLLTSNHLGSLWEEAEETAGKTDLIPESHEENGI